VTRTSSVPVPLIEPPTTTSPLAPGDREWFPGDQRPIDARAASLDNAVDRDALARANPHGLVNRDLATSTSISRPSRTTRPVSGWRSRSRFTAWELRVFTISESHSEKM
jgi:hypothetical protein